MTNIGVISDTHGLLRPEALNALRGSDLIIHAGDIGSPDILPALAKIAPVRAIAGNVDTEPWARNLPRKLQFEFQGTHILVIHNREDLKRVPKDAKVVIFGHSHQPQIDPQGEVLFFNPGSAGPRRFSLPIALGRLEIAKGEITPKLIMLPANSSSGQSI